MRIFVVALLSWTCVAVRHRMEQARLSKGMLHSARWLQAGAKDPLKPLAGLYFRFPHMVAGWNTAEFGRRPRRVVSMHAPHGAQSTPRNKAYSQSIGSQLQRRSLLLGSLGLLASESYPAFARTTNDVPSVAQILVPEVSKMSYLLSELDKVPLISTSFESPNSPEASLRYRSLGSFFGKGFQRARYLVLCFLPSSESLENEMEARSFQARETEFNDLDSLVVACSSQSGDDLRTSLIEKMSLTLPFLSDPNKELITAFGASSPKGDTCRSTFIIDTAGTIRWLDRDVKINSKDNRDYAQYVEQQLGRIRNEDSEAVIESEERA